MKKKIIYIAIAVLAVIVIVALSGRKKDKQEEVKSDSGIAVETSIVNAQEVESYVESTGNLTAKYSADVRSEISGKIREVYVNDWVKVKKGELLARIDSDELSATAARAKASAENAKAAYLESQTYLIKADRELVRMQNLKQSGLATQQQLDDANTEMAAAKARVSSAHAQVAAAQEDYRQAAIRLGKSDIVAPISGTIAARNANVGDMAGGDNSGTLFSIIDESIYDLNVSIPTVDIAGVGVGSRVEFTVDAFPDKVFEGKVAYVNPQVDTADRSVKVNIEVKNNENLLKSGFFAKAKIFTGNKSMVFLLPQSVLLGNDNAARKAKVYIVKDGIAVLKDVSIGHVHNGMVEVTSGLNDGDNVVVRGGFTVKDGDKVSAGK